MKEATNLSAVGVLRIDEWFVFLEESFADGVEAILGQRVGCKPYYLKSYVEYTLIH